MVIHIWYLYSVIVIVAEPVQQSIISVSSNTSDSGSHEHPSSGNTLVNVHSVGENEPIRKLLHPVPVHSNCQLFVPPHDANVAIHLEVGLSHINVISLGKQVQSLVLLVMVPVREIGKVFSQHSTSAVSHGHTGQLIGSPEAVTFMVVPPFLRQ